MFAIVEMLDVVRIPPNRFNTDLRSAAIAILKDKYESMISNELGYVIMIMDADVNPVGKIVHGDGSTYHKTTFRALTYYPTIQEIVEGEIVEVTEFGAFVRIGPTDALLHLSQIMDDFLSVDVKQGAITGSKSNKILRTGSTVRVRITAVSLKGGTMGKIGVTCRQPYLGAEEWIVEDVKRSRKSVEGKEGEEKVEIKEKGKEKEKEKGRDKGK
jgi:DNA-directed RNA polymerase subunit E'